MILTTDTIIGIVALVITIILGYYGIKYTFKFRKNTELFFLKISNISLFEDIVRNLDEIEIKFRGTKINEDLTLFKGAFFNSGNVDIEKSIIHKPLEIELPKDYNWIDFKIGNRSDGLEIDFTIDSNKVILKWDLLKEDEFFTFDSLIDYRSKPNRDQSIENDRIDLVKSLKIDHRITDLKTIKKEYTIPKAEPVRGYLFALLIFGFMGGYGIFNLYQSYFWPDYEIYYEAKVSKSKEWVLLEATKPDEISFRSNKGNEVLLTKKDSVSKILTGNIAIKKKKINYNDIATYTFTALIGLIFITAFTILFFRSRKKFNKFKSLVIGSDLLNKNE